jgi:hypothetical protein
MGQEYPMEVRVKAKGFYTADGLTYEAVAAKLAELFPAPTPSRTQIQRWAQDEGWRDRKSQRRQKAQEFEDGTFEFQTLLLNKSLELMRTMVDEDLPLDSQTLHGLVNVARVIIPKQSGKAEEDAAPDLDRPALFLEDMQFIAKCLKEIDPEGLKVLARNFDVIVARFKAEHAQTS